jgi:hypothetical protein
MMKNKKYLPYIRRPNGREKCDTFRLALQLAAHRLSKRPFYVMVQHGFRNSVMAVGATRKELEKSPIPVLAGRCSFRQWAKRIQRRALGQ